MQRPSRPASRKTSKRSCGYSPVSSTSRARGFTFSWAILRQVACSSASSSGSSKSMNRQNSQGPTGFDRSALRFVFVRLRAGGGSGRLATLADDAPPLALGGPAPDAVLLAVGDGVLEARLPYRALLADGLRLFRLL